MKLQQTSSPAVVISINSIVRETEAAICVNCPVQWGSGKWHERNVWFPKSQVVAKMESRISVNGWFLGKVENENSFKGMRMKFEEWLAVCED